MTGFLKSPRTLSVCACLFLTLSAFGHDPFDSSRADAHAPIGVMGDHTHKKGEWMVSLRSMRMSMAENREGTGRLSTGEVLQRYMVAPLEMDMTMHMLGVMYAPSDSVTLMAMINYVENEMDHVTRMGMNFQTESDGLGDSNISALWRIYADKGANFHLNLGVSLPTGDVDVRGATPMGPNMKLPYPMQIGSGTYDLKLGGTYTRQLARWSYGSQLMATLPTGENDSDYTLGNRYLLQTWAALPAGKMSSFSLRLAGHDWDNIDGADPELNPMMVATADPNLRAGSRIDVGIGFNLKLGKHRLAAEYNLPIYQDLEGPQLEIDNMFQLGWQYAF